jgi:Kelch motif
MNRSFFLVSRSEKKVKKISKLPKLRLRFGPTSPLHVPHGKFKFLKSPKNTMPVSLSPTMSPSPNFIDDLISRYESKKYSSINIGSKSTKSEEISVYWSVIDTKGYIPEARSGATINIINHTIYILGGERSEQSSYMKKLDYRSLMWENVIPANTNTLEVPMIRSGHTSVIYKNYLVVYGGFTSFNLNLQIRNCISLVYLYDTNTNIWRSYKPAGPVSEARRNHCAALIGSSLTVYSGVDSKGSLVPSISVLDLKAMRWLNFKINGEIPTPRSNCSLTSAYHPSLLDHFNFDIFSVPKVYDNVYTKQTSGLYMFGGLGKTGKVFNDIHLLKGLTTRNEAFELVWEKITPAGNEPVPRHSHSANLCGGFLVIMGGRNDNISNSIVDQLAILRISNWRWESIKIYGDSPSARIGASTASINSKLLILGGMYLTGYASSALYQLETDPKIVSEYINL